jgi:N-acetyl-anhydromuramyl-L-alanine amidase AmpD
MRLVAGLVRLTVTPVVVALLLCGCTGVPVRDTVAHQSNLFNEERLRLTADYARRHYGLEGYELREPQIIVLHYTAFPTLDESMRFFFPSLLDTGFRRDISAGGAVNVSVHYLVDTDGTVYQTAQENVICRHTIGFNHSAIGIENVGSGAENLTEQQAEADAALIRRILDRHPSIRFLIGHHEYRDSWRPHHKLFRENDPAYRLTDKIDPGAAFMGRVRTILAERYGISLAD